MSFSTSNTYIVRNTKGVSNDVSYLEQIAVVNKLHLEFSVNELFKLIEFLLHFHGTQNFTRDFLSEHILLMLCIYLCHSNTVFLMNANKLSIVPAGALCIPTMICVIWLSAWTKTCSRQFISRFCKHVCNVLYIHVYKQRIRVLSCKKTSQYYLCCIL